MRKFQVGDRVVCTDRHHKNAHGKIISPLRRRDSYMVEMSDGEERDFFDEEMTLAKDFVPEVEKIEIPKFKIGEDVCCNDAEYDDVIGEIAEVCERKTYQSEQLYMVQFEECDENLAFYESEIEPIEEQRLADKLIEDARKCADQAVVTGAIRDYLDRHNLGWDFICYRDECLQCIVVEVTFSDNSMTKSFIADENIERADNLSALIDARMESICLDSPESRKARHRRHTKARSDSGVSDKWVSKTADCSKFLQALTKFNEGLARVALSSIPKANENTIFCEKCHEMTPLSMIGDASCSACGHIEGRCLLCNGLAYERYNAQVGVNDYVCIKCGNEVER